MKMFVVLALVAAAVAEPEAEADAQYISTYGAYGAHAYSPYTHGLPLNTYSATPLVRSYPASATPLVRSYTPYQSTYGLYNRHFIAKREAEAEADPALIYGSYAGAPLASTYSTPLTTYSHIASPLTSYSHLASPFVRTVASPVVRTVASPVVRTVASPLVHALASHTVTSYNSPNHYTAVSNGVYGPSYVAKNGAVQHVVKREAEADPALIYNTPLASTYAVASPLAATYNHVATPLTTTYNHVATPLTTTYNHVATPLTTTYNHVATPLTTTYNHVASPLTTTYNHVVSPYNVAARVVAAPVTYTNVATPVVAATHLASNGAHAVAATYNGWTHSSNVGVCTNVNGQQVAC